MKPPVRTRSAPLRYEIQEKGQARPTAFRLAWTYREKRALLKGLRAQGDTKDPQPEIKGRSQSEVSSYISWLRGRAAREAIQTEYEKWVKEKKGHSDQTPAPIELWTDLACRMGNPTEESVTSAFSQMLTIAATEPANLRHSIPSKGPGVTVTGATSNQRLQQTGSSEEGSGSSGEEPAVSGDKADDGWQNLDFEKIYKYLSKVASGGELPKLSEYESAVLLRLLHCIPDQFPALDTEQIERFLHQSYTFMNSQPDEDDSATEETQPCPQTSSWKDVGFCPLNPFLLPLNLLKQKE